jgi:hypothetical protein
MNEPVVGGGGGGVGGGGLGTPQQERAVRGKKAVGVLSNTPP